MRPYNLFFKEEIQDKKKEDSVIPVGRMPGDIFNHNRELEIPCPICNGTHRYNAVLESMNVLAAPHPDDYKLVILECTRIFKCPVKNQMFQCTFQVEWIFGLGKFVQDITVSDPLG